MELFYAYDCDGTICRLDQNESAHAIKVLRHRAGDEINIIDGRGTMYLAKIIEDSPKAAVAMVSGSVEDFGTHPYQLSLAVCPTKNNDRYEWFVEKAVELGVDAIVPIIADHSERKIFKSERARKIVLSATKQSLKAKIAVVEEPLPLKKYIDSLPADTLKLIAYCFEGDEQRQSIKTVLENNDCTNTVILIGPEGDFSKEEAQYAISKGFRPISLGASR